MNGATSLSKEQLKTCALLQSRLYLLRRLNHGGILERIGEMEGVLCAKYPDAQHYTLFTLFTGGDWQRAGGLFDFPEPDSIEKFINDQYVILYPESAHVHPRASVISGGAGEEAHHVKLSWLDRPLRLEPSVLEPHLKGKIVMVHNGREIPFHGEFRQKPRETWWQRISRRYGLKRHGK